MSSFFRIVLPMIFIALSLVLSNCEAQETGNQVRVTINSNILYNDDILELESVYGVKPIEGDYWYDSVSGIFGVVYGPATGVMFPGHEFGPLTADASNGTSGVFINGRQLQYSEATYIARLFGYGSLIPGKYWLLSNGNMGIEGYSASFGNVYYAISNQNRGSGGKNFWQKGLYSAGNYYTGTGGQASMGYVSVPGYGPISHGFD